MPLVDGQQYDVLPGTGVLTLNYVQSPSLNLIGGHTSLTRVAAYTAADNVLIEIALSEIEGWRAAHSETTENTHVFADTGAGVNTIAIPLSVIQTAAAGDIYVGGNTNIANSTLQFRASVGHAFSNANTDDSLFDDTLFVDTGVTTITGVELEVAIDSATAASPPTTTTAGGAACGLVVSNLDGLFADAVEKNANSGAASREVGDGFELGDILQFPNGIELTVKLPITHDGSAPISGDASVIDVAGSGLSVDDATSPLLLSTTYTSDLYIRLI